MSERKPRGPKKPRKRAAKAPPVVPPEVAVNGDSYRTADYRPASIGAVKDDGPLCGTRGDEMVEGEVSWLIPGFVPWRMVTVVAGDGDVGKTTWMSAVVSYLTGGDSPYGSLQGVPGKALWLTSEEDPSCITKPKLLAAGANMSRVWFPLHDRYGGKQRHLSLPSGLAKLEAMIAEEGARIVVLDPISSFLDSGFDDNKRTYVRPLVETLNGVCQQHGAILLATLHNNKSREGPALARVGGSGAWTQTPRMVVLLGKDPDNEGQGIIAIGRTSFGRKAQSVRYTIVGHLGHGRFLPSGVTDLTAADLGNVSTLGGDRDHLADAKMVLVALLEDGEKPAKEVEKLAEEAGIKYHALRKAKESLKVGLKQVWTGQTNHWVWFKPENGWPS